MELMKTTCLLASVEHRYVVTFWNEAMLDDVSRHDESKLALTGFLSDNSWLMTSIAQGRKLSVDLFIRLMRRLTDALRKHAGGVAATADGNIKD